MKILFFVLLNFVLVTKTNAQLNTYLKWLDRKHESSVISLGVCSYAGECSSEYSIILYSDGTFASDRFDNQGCYAYSTKSHGTFEIKDSIFTLKSIVPDSFAAYKNYRKYYNLTEDRFGDETGKQLIVRNQKLYAIFPNKKENGYLILRSKKAGVK